MQKYYTKTYALTKVEGISREDASEYELMSVYLASETDAALAAKDAYIKWLQGRIARAIELIERGAPKVAIDALNDSEYRRR